MRDSTIKRINIVNTIYKEFDTNNGVCMVFLDIAKAFHRVLHDGLSFNTN